MARELGRPLAVDDVRPPAPPRRRWPTCSSSHSPPGRTRRSPRRASNPQLRLGRARPLRPRALFARHAVEAVSRLSASAATAIAARSLSRTKPSCVGVARSADQRPPVVLDVEQPDRLRVQTELRPASAAPSARRACRIRPGARRRRRRAPPSAPSARAVSDDVNSLSPVRAGSRSTTSSLGIVPRPRRPPRAPRQRLRAHQPTRPRRRRCQGRRPAAAAPNTRRARLGVSRHPARSRAPPKTQTRRTARGYPCSLPWRDVHVPSALRPACLPAARGSRGQRAPTCGGSPASSATTGYVSPQSSNDRRLRDARRRAGVPAAWRVLQAIQENDTHGSDRCRPR